MNRSEGAASHSATTIFASFGIRADMLQPDEITKKLGIQPTRCFARGDQYYGHISKTEKAYRSRPWGVWQVSSEGVVKSDNLQDHVDYILGLIQPKRAEIDALLADKEFYLGISFWVESPERGNEFTLRSDSVGALAALCRDFNVSIISRPEGTER